MRDASLATAMNGVLQELTELTEKERRRRGINGRKMAGRKMKKRTLFAVGALLLRYLRCLL